MANPESKGFDIGKASHGKAWRGGARQGGVRSGEVRGQWPPLSEGVWNRHGKARHGGAWSGVAGLGSAGRGEGPMATPIRRGLESAWQGWAGRGEARLGQVWLGKAREPMAHKNQRRD